MSDQDIEIIMDDLTVGELDPQTWYSFTQLEIGLLHNHIQELEKQINESVVAYQKEKVVTDVVDDGDGYSLAILEEHRGIEAPPDHLEEIYEYYFLPLPV